MQSYKTISEKILSFAEIDWEKDEKAKKTCLVGVEILISTIINFIIILLIGVILRISTEVFIYIMFFIPLRLFSGGRHAKNHVNCILLYCVCMISVILSSKVWGYYNGLIIVGFNVIVCLILQLKYAGINKNRDKIINKKNRKMAFRFMLVEIVIIINILLLSINSQENLIWYAIIASGAMLVQSVFLIPNKGNNVNMLY